MNHNVTHVHLVTRLMGSCRTVEFSRRERAARDDVKKATILRAKRSAATMGSAAVTIKIALSARYHVTNRQ